MATLINIQCPECKTIQAAPATYLNQKVRCLQCGGKFYAIDISPTPPISEEKNPPNNNVLGTADIIKELQKISKATGFLVTIVWIIIILIILAFFLNLVNVLIQQMQYENMKKTATLDEVLKKHIEINNAKLNIIQDIPFIGGAVARLMGDFNDTEFLKESRVIFNNLDKSTGQ
jgi:hypothetical protein